MTAGHTSSIHADQMYHSRLDISWMRCTRPASRTRCSAAAQNIGRSNRSSGGAGEGGQENASRGSGGAGVRSEPGGWPRVFASSVSTRHLLTPSGYSPPDPRSFHESLQHRWRVLVVELAEAEACH